MSLEQRRDVLAARYVAWDLVQRGYAIEAGGSYHLATLDTPEEKLALETWQGLTRSTDGMDPVVLLYWLAVGRLMTLDQIIMLDPDNAWQNVETLRDLHSKHLVSARRIPMGRGSLEVWELTPKAWRGLSQTYIDLRSRGFGPRRRLSRFDNTIITSCNHGRYTLHPLLQVDAILWFVHDFESRGARVTDIFLERALAAEGGNLKGARMLDFRLMAENEQKIRTSCDVEVIGVGHSYHSIKKKKVIEGSVPHKSFSGASSHVAVGRHVCIGR